MGATGIELDRVPDSDALSNVRGSEEVGTGMERDRLPVLDALSGVRGPDIPVVEVYPD